MVSWSMLGDLRKCVAFLTDSGFDAPCDISHPLAWMLSILWSCGATNEQIKGMFDWTCRVVEEHELTGAKMPAGDWGFCFCEVPTRRGSGNGRTCAGDCPSPADEGSALRADREGRLRIRW